MVQELVDYRELIEIGIQEFNAGDFFTCHDTFEEIWMETRGEHRRFLQGMIQSAVGIYHATQGNLRGAFSQTDKALAKLGEYPADYLGIDVEKFRTELAILHESVRQSLLDNTTGFDSSLIPMIDYIAEESLSVLDW